MRWVKLFTTEWIDGSIRTDLTPAERGVWADLIVLAGLSRREGHIERSEGIPFSVQEIATRCVVDVELLQSTIDKCVAEGRITISKNQTISITNWEKYQFVPDGKARLAETAEERKLRELRQLSRLQREYPNMAVTEETETIVDEQGEIKGKRKTQKRVVSDETA
jgi:hypothetical protein